MMQRGGTEDLQVIEKSKSTINTGLLLVGNITKDDK